MKLMYFIASTVVITALAAQAQPAGPLTTVTTNTTVATRRHNINVTLTSLEDLKVHEKQRIKKGDVISDHTSSRQQLEAKKQQLEMAIAQLSTPTPPIAPLPEPSYEIELANIKAAQSHLENVDSLITNAGESRFTDKELAAVMDRKKLEEVATLKQKRIEAEIELEKALAQLDEAKSRYQQQRYQHSISIANYQNNLQRQQYEMASLVAQLSSIEKSLLETASVKSPYSGRIRRIKILNQSDRTISAQVVLDIREPQATAE